MTGLEGGDTTHSNIYADDNQYFQYRVNFDTNRISWNYYNEGDLNSEFARLNTMTINYTLIGAVTTCDCPASGNWEINDGSVCTLSTLCNITGDLHITNGSLNVTSTGILDIPTTKRIILEKAQVLSIEKGGQLVVHK